MSLSAAAPGFELVGPTAFHPSAFDPEAHTPVATHRAAAPLEPQEASRLPRGQRRGRAQPRPRSCARVPLTGGWAVHVAAGGGGRRGGAGRRARRLCGCGPGRGRRSCGGRAPDGQPAHGCLLAPLALCAELLDCLPGCALRELQAALGPAAQPQRLGAALDALHRPTRPHLTPAFAQRTSGSALSPGSGHSPYTLCARTLAFHELFFAQLRLKQLRRDVRCGGGGAHRRRLRGGSHASR